MGLKESKRCVEGIGDGRGTGGEHKGTGACIVDD